MCPSALKGRKKDGAHRGRGHPDALDASRHRHETKDRRYARPRGRSSGFLTSAAKQLDVELRRARPQRKSTRTRLPGSDPGHHLKRLSSEALLSMNSL